MNSAAVKMTYLIIDLGFNNYTQTRPLGQRPLVLLVGQAGRSTSGCSRQPYNLQAHTDLQVLQVQLAHLCGFDRRLPILWLP